MSRSSGQSLQHNSTHLSLCIHVCTGFKQTLHDIAMPAVTCQVQRCVLILNMCDETDVCYVWVMGVEREIPKIQ